jgi:hypothetical protein
MAAWLAKLELRQLWMLGAGVIVLLVAGLATRGVLPQLKAWRAAGDALEAMEAQAAAAQPVADVVAAESAQVIALGERLRGAMMDVPARELEAVVVGRLQRVSSRHDVELTSVRPGRGERVDAFEQLLFDVELSGHYADLYAWLKDLRTELDFVVIEHYAIERVPDDASEDPALRASLTLASYRAVGT